MNTSNIKFLKTKEVARLLQLNQLTIYTYIREGRLPAIKFGKNFRVSEKDLGIFIKRNMFKVQK